MKTFKKLILLSTLMALILSKTYAQTDSITISGTLKGLEDKGVWISFASGKEKAKSYRGTSNQDNFSFKVPKQNTPAIARFDVNIKRSLSALVNGNNYGSPAPSLDLVVYNKDIKINGEALLVQLSMVTGDDENNFFNVYKQQVKTDEKLAYETSIALFEANYNNKPLVGDANKMKAASSEARNRTYQKQKEFISKNPDAFASLFLLSRLQNLYNANDYTAAWNNLSNKYKNHALTAGILAYLERVSSTLAGANPTDFERKDKDGKIVKLSNYKGKTVLLDFWGSWCGPCRASHPHLKELYKKYKSKGFEIIAVAHEYGKTVEASKATWLKAIAEDDINWVHLLNQDGIEKQDIVKDYNISGFPTKILIDQNGKIILRVTASATDDIDKALKKIYGF